jgi:hypothetical protein
MPVSGAVARPGASVSQCRGSAASATNALGNRHFVAFVVDIFSRRIAG